MYARLIQDCGYSLMHLAGNGMHRSLLLADRSLVTMSEMAERATTIARVLDIPILVDGETGYGGPEQTARSVRFFEHAGAAGIRYEDSIFGDNGIGRMGHAAAQTVEQMVDKIKAATDARTDEALVLVVRMDSRPVESFEAFRERIDRYVEAGVDAVGVGLSSMDEIRQVGANPPVPLVNPWPRNNINSTDEFFGLGYKVALMTSFVSLAGLSAARNMLQELKRTGRVDKYFAEMPGYQDIRHWYEDLGFRPTQPLP
jgi:2-methylisocitrate lyase-like PEP mutase family enzyme